MPLYFSNDHKVHASSVKESANFVTTQLPFQADSTETVHVKEINEAAYGYIKYDKTSGILYCNEIIEGS